MFVTEDELSEELKADRALLSGSLHGWEKDKKLSDRYCNPKDAQQAARDSEQKLLVGDHKSDEELPL